MRDDLQNLMRYNGSVPAVAALPLLLKYNHFFLPLKHHATRKPLWLLLTGTQCYSVYSFFATYD